MKERGFVIMRKTSIEGEDVKWLDMDTFSFDISLTRSKAFATDREMPEWARHNPQVRLARVSIERIK